MKKHRHIGSTSPIEHQPLTDIPEEYGVVSKTEKILGVANYMEARRIALNINGKVWATVQEDGRTVFLYQV